MISNIKSLITKRISANRMPLFLRQFGSFHAKTVETVKDTLQDLEEDSVQQFQEEVLEELYSLRNLIAQEMRNAEVEAKDMLTDQQKDQIRKQVSQEFIKEREASILAIEKSNARIEHLKQTLIEVVEENNRLNDTEEIKKQARRSYLDDLNMII